MTENPTTTPAILEDDEGDPLHVYPWASGRVSLVARDRGHRVEFGPVERHVLLDAIREVAGETDEPAPAPAATPTAEDFARAEFARHGGGQIAAALGSGNLRWAVRRSTWGAWLSDADMADEGGWSIVTPAPSTPREALALVVDLAYEPEGDKMPDQPGYVMVREGGGVSAFSDSDPSGLPARGATYRLLLLDPPAPVTPARPKGAEEIESQIEEWDHEYGDDAIMTAPRLRELADFLAERGVRVVSEDGAR